MMPITTTAMTIRAAVVTSDREAGRVREVLERVEHRRLLCEVCRVE